MKGRPLGLNLAKRTIASFGFIKRGFSKDLREIYKCKKDQSESSLCKINEKLIKEMKMIPDPPGCRPLPFEYNSTGEPEFDSKVHLALEKPKFRTVFDEKGGFEQLQEYKCAPNSKGSSFAYCEPFQLFTDEGAKDRVKNKTKKKTFGHP